MHRVCLLQAVQVAAARVSRRTSVTRKFMMSLFMSSFRILTASSLRLQSDSEILRLSEACSTSRNQLNDARS